MPISGPAAFALLAALGVESVADLAALPHLSHVADSVLDDYAEDAAE